MANTLISFLNKLNKFILNDYWKAIESICTKKTFELLKICIEPAFEIIKNIESNNITITFIIEFFGKMIYRDSIFFHQFIEKQFFQFLLKYIIQFPDSSNLIGSIFRLLKNILKDQILLKIIIKEFIPILIFEATSKIRSATSARSIIFLRELKEIAKTDFFLKNNLDQIDMFKEFCEHYLIWYDELISTGYGGTIERNFSITQYHAF